MVVVSILLKAVRRTNSSFPFCFFVSPRESLCSVLLALEHHLDEIASTGEKLVSLNELIVRTDKQMDIFKEAITTTDHPLISMQDK